MTTTRSLKSRSAGWLILMNLLRSLLCQPGSMTRKRLTAKAKKAKKTRRVAFSGYSVSLRKTYPGVRARRKKILRSTVSRNPRRRAKSRRVADLHVIPTTSRVLYPALSQIWKTLKQKEREIRRLREMESHEVVKIAKQRESQVGPPKNYLPRYIHHLLLVVVLCLGFPLC